MKVIARIFLFLFLPVLACLLIGFCRRGIGSNPGQISQIHSPDELPSDLSRMEFYLFKRGDFGAKIIVQAMDNTVEHLYHNPRYVSRVDVSPDHEHLVYVQMITEDKFMANRLFWVDLESGRERRIAGWDQDFSEISLTNPGYTQDGRQVLFTVTWYDTGQIGLARVNINGTGLEILDTDLPLNEGPEPSPDGSLIMVTCAGFDLLTGKPGFQLCLLDGNGRFIKFLTRRGTGHGNYYFIPNSNKISYSESDFGGIFGIIKKPTNYLIIQDLESGEFTQILDWEVGVLGFSPDGEEILFRAKQKPRSPWRIYLIKVDGTDLRHLAYFDRFLDRWYADARE